MSKIINDRIEKYIIHKTFILVERVYLAIIDKIYDAEHNDTFEIDNENNIYITYSSKRDESIIEDANEYIIKKIKKKYRKKLEIKLEEEGYYVEFDDDDKTDISVYFDETLNTDNDSSSSVDSNEFNKKEYTSIIFADSDQNINKSSKVSEYPNINKLNISTPSIIIPEVDACEYSESE